MRIEADKPGTGGNGRGASPGAGGLPRVAIIVSRYNRSVTQRLLSGARGEYERRGGHAADLEILEAPGAFEVPQVALAAARSGGCRAVVALACIVRGETRHDRYLAQAVTGALMSIALQTGLPVGYGVLTVDKPRQADERSGGEKGNKGAEAMGAVLDTLGVIEPLRARPAPAGAPIRAGAG